MAGGASDAAAADAFYAIDFMIKRGLHDGLVFACGDGFL